MIGTWKLKEENKKQVKALEKEGKMVRRKE